MELQARRITMAPPSQLKLGDDYFYYMVVLLIIALPYVFRKHNIVVYFGKYFIFNFLNSVIAMLCIPIFALDAKNVKNILHVAYYFKHVTVLLGMKWDLRDMEHLAEDRGAIIVANHQTIFDVLGMYNYWHVMQKCAAIAKKELLYFWPFGLAAWLGGVVFIDRASSRQSYETLYKTAELMKKDKTKLFIFPEGTRNNNASRTLKFLPFKKGAFRIAIKTKAPILPIVYSPYYFLDVTRYYFGPGKVIVKALPAISTENLTEKDVESLMETTRDAMYKTFLELTKEVASSLPENHFLHKAILDVDKAP